jgi:hypothetical protein
LRLGPLPGEAMMYRGDLLRLLSVVGETPMLPPGAVDRPVSQLKKGELQGPTP